MPFCIIIFCFSQTLFLDIITYPEYFSNREWNLIIVHYNCEIYSMIYPSVQTFVHLFIINVDLAGIVLGSCRQIPINSLVGYSRNSYQPQT